MKKVAPGIYVEETDELRGPEDPGDRHGRDLKKQLTALRKEEKRVRRTKAGGMAYDADDHPAMDHKETKGGTVVPSMLEEKEIEDSHGKHVFHVAGGSGNIPGVADAKKAKYGTKGVTKRTIGDECTDIVDVKEDFYP
jgi:hypothetical protein